MSGDEQFDEAARSRRALLYTVVCVAAALAMLALRSAPANLLAPLELNIASTHLVLEMFAVLIAMMVVLISWHAFDPRQEEAGSQRFTGVLITGFTVIATCDVLHVLNYPGMPGTAETDGPAASIFFWLAGRTTEVFVVACIAFRLAPNLRRHAALALGVALSTLLAWIGLSRLEWLPETYVAGQGVTPFKARVEYALCASNLALAAILMLRARAEPGQHLGLLAVSSYLIGVGALAFTSYGTVSDFQNVAGHLYKIASYATLFYATVIASLRAPFASMEASERRAVQSERRLSTVADSLPGVFFYEARRLLDGTMRFDYVSAGCERMLGVTPAEVLADSNALYSLVDREDMKMLLAARDRSMESLQIFDARMRVRRRDGRLVLVHGVSSPVRNDDGTTTWYGTITDITERVEVEEKRRSLEDQLRQSQKLEEIGILAGGIAHDFNNLIGSILGNVSMAKGDLEGKNPAGAAESLDQVNRAALRARDLVRQILNFSRRGMSGPTVCRLQPLLAETLALLRSTVPQSVHIDRRIELTAINAKVDATQFSQVVLNLCTNAWHAIGAKGGRIEVGLDAVSLDEAHAGGLGLAVGCYAHVWVEDNGCGMDAATLARLYEPFFTTKPAGTGTGLGMPVVQGILAAHGGAMGVRSAVGIGTRFDVYLPLVTESSDLRAAPEAPQSAPRTAAPSEVMINEPGPRVLYIDDDDLMTLMVDRLLSQAGFRVSCFQDPLQAIEAVQANPSSFDIVVTDYNMPLHSGIEVIRQIREAEPALPALLTSGSVTPELRELAAGLGVVRVLEKQNTLEELAGAVREAVCSG